MSNSKIKVYATYDTHNGTWNVMNDDNECMFYGDIEAIELWMLEHIETHYEEVS